MDMSVLADDSPGKVSLQALRFPPAGVVMTLPFEAAHPVAFC